MDKSVFLEDLDAFAYREVLSSGESIVLIPVGSLEQHGPHLPLGTDTLLSSRFAEGVANRLGALVAEPIAYGYKSQQKSGGGNHLSGTTSLDGATLIGVARNLVKSFLNQGVRHVVFVNGHFENYQFLYEGIDLALEDLGVKPGAEQSVLLLSYWDFVSQDTLAKVYPDGFPGWEIEHGGVLETSLMLHLEPARVGMDRLVDGPAAVLPRFDRLPVVPERTPATGCLSSAAGSSAAKGELLYRQVVEDLAMDLARELNSERNGPATAPPSADYAQ
ncbi:creatininase [Pseudarthrobacter sulfonivorans]|uniref:creatininase n=1 Tax=Pseudarthrobacter sulfonivorans TaxID=121292 RepID=UPI00285B2305|nr:creatininase [Pseudarthrobacter sulfonivorans]MDR6414630.1 creatinine amidohydrolase [Pseudarthrobacter sulfonivorans]